AGSSAIVELLFAPGRYVVIVCVFPASVACTGDPASAPRNSPICHCRARIHKGSRICACKLRANDASRGCGSRRVQLEIDGLTIVALATDLICIDRLRESRKLG